MTTAIPPRRRLVGAGSPTRTGLALAVGAVFCASPAWADVSRPQLALANQAKAATLGAAYAKAVTNLIDTNTVAYDASTYNSTGFLSGGKFIRAGAGYQQPWTRDAALNSWSAASLLEPEIARNTLWSAVTKDQQKLIVQQDNQWWDQVIWIHAAWNHYLVTGDRVFLADAYTTAQNTLTARQKNFNASEGLYEGPSFFNDGIAGYPAPPANEHESQGSFVLDYVGTDRVMALSTNAVYYQAHRSAALMASALGKPATEVAALDAAADSLKAKINARFWLSERGMYAYLLHDGVLDTSEEGTGLSFVMLFGIADAERTASILAKTHVQPFGIVDVYPHFPRYSQSKPGRHNVMVWPMVQGFWAQAAAQAGNEAVFAREVETLAKLANDNAGFFEIYDASTGKPDGGWQTEKRSSIVPDQTWSATAYLRMIHYGLFGMTFTASGLGFAPLVPQAWGSATLSGFKYRGMDLQVSLTGSGDTIASFKLDGALPTEHVLPTTLTGSHLVEIAMTPRPPAGTGGTGGAGGTGGQAGGGGGASGSGGPGGAGESSVAAGSPSVAGGPGVVDATGGSSGVNPVVVPNPNASPTSDAGGCGCHLTNDERARPAIIGAVFALAALRRRRTRRR